jgi:uncharacterized damage-inducible protein DinB
MMKRIWIVVCLMALPVFGAEATTPQDLRGYLLEQLKTTHNQKDWFVPVSIALAGLTPEQASWKDGKGNHSAGQLANHLLFWNQRELEKLKGTKPPSFSGNNEETFDRFDAKSWAATVQKLDSVLTEMEALVKQVDQKRLASLASDVGHIATHNAYHTGQIIYVRKEQGSWNPDNGVK